MFFLHQTTTTLSTCFHNSRCMSCSSYIKPQHVLCSILWTKCCMSCSSYIKPQHIYDYGYASSVVCLVLPTSNHNACRALDDWAWLYVLFFLHQTTTYCLLLFVFFLLYVLFFLHQTTTLALHTLNLYGCMSCSSYIKPQLLKDAAGVYLSCMSCSSYIKPQPAQGPYGWRSVVCLVLPTSNHNLFQLNKKIIMLYVLFFLHQTTTPCNEKPWGISCMSCSSYIKPQPIVAKSLIIKA